MTIIGDSKRVLGDCNGQWVKVKVKVKGDG